MTGHWAEDPYRPGGAPGAVRRGRHGPVPGPGGRRARPFAVVVALVAVLLLGACTAARQAEGPGPAPPRSASPAAGSPAGLPAAPRVLATGLAVPWGIAFLPEGDALVTERDTARLLRITPQGKVTEVGVVEGVSPSGEGGLLGVAVSPTYPRDRFIFVYATTDRDNRIIRYRYDGRLADPVAIVTGIPKGGIHNGGRLAFGPDGYLYASTGDAGEAWTAANRDSLGGKILRMTMDGRPAPGNPFGTLVWSYGHRNVQGMAWDDEGRMYATEFGQSTFDEINLIEKGRNHGWPEVEGVGDRAGYADPIVTWSTDEASPSGLAYANGSLWAASLRGERLWQVPLTDSGRVGRPVAHFTGEYGRLRAVAVAPDGTLWVSTSNRDGRGSVRSGDDRILVIQP
ncbi:PQQ-dependent sugar dehydrogenase [Thermobispora bispora]|nr:PQQ-dependent sugar dehydrogenase [Thermobispora bispora]MBO2476003.1 glucose sorbosone dehydrogenase [Actinomycetales bacterium]QSI49147.1 PQQ-dependent sugar dehydrogenase [Thermobispora bispora]